MEIFIRPVLIGISAGSLFCIPFFFNTGKIVVDCEAIEPTWVNCKARQFHLLGLKPLGKAHSIERIQAISVGDRADL